MENNMKNGNEFTPCTQFLFYFLVAAENISSKREIEVKKKKSKCMDHLFNILNICNINSVTKERQQ